MKRVKTTSRVRNILELPDDCLFSILGFLTLKEIWLRHRWINTDFKGLCSEMKLSLVANRKCPNCDNQPRFYPCIIYANNSFQSDIEFYCVKCTSACSVCSELTIIKCESYYFCNTVVCYKHSFRCCECADIICNGRLCARIDAEGGRICIYCSDKMTCLHCNINVKNDVYDIGCIECPKMN